MTRVRAGQETTIQTGNDFFAPPLPDAPPLQDRTPIVRAGQETTIQTGNDFFAPPLPSVTLGTIIGAYKSTTARLINGLRHTPGAPIWQRNYYEHILRDEKELAHIHAYINANPASWGNDEENR